jgi:predicted RecB family nuclease
MTLLKKCFIIMKTLDELYKACMSGGKIDRKFIINPSMVLLHTVSPFNLWCDFFAPKEKRDPEPESLRILAKIGKIEEEKYVEEKYPGMQRIEVETVEQAFFEVLKGCFEGVEAFHLAPLIYLPEGMLGIPDLLEKSADHKSLFGNHHYVVKEKKTTKEPKHKHILQTALNNYVLGRIQGYAPPEFVILNRENEEFEFAFDRYATELQDSIARITEIMNGKLVTPTRGSLQEPWKSFGLEKAKEIGDISLVPGVAPAKKELLAKLWMNTIFDLEKASINAFKIKGIGAETLAKWQIHAASISQSKIIVINRASLIKHSTEIFLDLEGTFDVSNLFLEDFGIESNQRWTNVIYLIGVLVVENGKREYTPYFADSIDKEKEILEKLVSLLKSKSDFVIYH